MPTTTTDRATPRPPAPQELSCEVAALCQRVVDRLVAGSDRLRRDREDLLQEALLIAWQHQGGPLQARVVRCRLIDRIRSIYGRTSASVDAPSRRAVAVLEPLDERLLEAVVPELAAPPPDEEVAARDDVERIRGAIARLPDREREVLLATVHDVPLRRLAEGHGLTESALSRRRRAARDHLAELLAMP